MAKQKENAKIDLIGPNSTIQIEQHPSATRKHPLLAARIITKNSGSQHAQTPQQNSS